MFGLFPPVWACHGQVKDGWGHNPSAETKWWGTDTKIRPAIPLGWQHIFGETMRWLGRMKLWQCECSEQAIMSLRLILGCWWHRDLCVTPALTYSNHCRGQREGAGTSWLQSGKRTPHLSLCEAKGPHHVILPRDANPKSLISGKIQSKTWKKFLESFFLHLHF